VALVSVDAGGAVSRLLPAAGDQARAVEPGVVHARAGVTASAGIERLLVLFDREPFEVSEAAEAASRALGSGAAAEGAEPAPAPRLAASWWFRHAEISR